MDYLASNTLTILRPTDNWVKAEAAVNAVVGFHSIFHRLGKVFGSVLNVILVAPLLLFILTFLAIFMVILRIRIGSKWKHEFILSKDNYKAVRIELESLNKVKSAFDSLPQNSLALNVVLGFLQLLWMRRIVSQRIEYIGGKLIDFNPLITDLDRQIVPISQDDLWRNRSKAYDYLL